MVDSASPPVDASLLFAEKRYTIYIKLTRSFASSDTEELFSRGSPRRL
jgi:hypothetical protein